MFRRTFFNAISSAILGTIVILHLPKNLVPIFDISIGLWSEQLIHDFYHKIILPKHNPMESRGIVTRVSYFDRDLRRNGIGESDINMLIDRFKGKKSDVVIIKNSAYEN